MLKQNFGLDEGGRNAYDLPIVTSEVLHLQASTDTSYTIPSGTNKLLITPQPGVLLFCSYTDISASLPVAGAAATVVAKPIVMPTNITMTRGENTLHLYCITGDAYITIELFGSAP